MAKGHGYFYVAPGVRAGYDEEPIATLQFGGGGEAFFTRNLGLGVDVGGLRWFEQDWFVVISPNFVVRFRGKSDENKVEPFVTAGGTVFTGVNYDNGLNFGGGLNYWLKDRLGLRFEVREHDAGRYVNQRHLIEFRIGLTFR